jgi:hypothetical protein
MNTGGTNGIGSPMRLNASMGVVSSIGDGTPGVHPATFSPGGVTGIS